MSNDGSRPSRPGTARRTGSGTCAWSEWPMLGITPELDAGDGTKATLEAARATAATWPGIHHPTKPGRRRDPPVRSGPRGPPAPRHPCRPGPGTRRRHPALHRHPGRFVRVGATSVPPHSPRSGTAAVTYIAGRARAVRPDPDRGHPPPPRGPDPAGRRARRRHERPGLERVRTASKVAVRLVWEVGPELPAGTRSRP